MLYKVKEVAFQCGVSTAAIYKELKRIDNEFTTVVNGVTCMNEDGLQYFLERFGSSASASSNDELVSSLLRQLEEKDKQIARLMDQARNFQLLIKAEQDKLFLMAKPKQSFLQWLFRRSVC